MPAFGGNQVYQINENIRTLGRRLLNASAKRLSDDQFLQLFVAPHLHEAFKDVAHLVVPAAYTQAGHIVWPNGERIDVTYDSTKLLTLKKLELQDTAPSELVQSITAWTTRANISREAGRVMAVFAWLNAKCSRQEMRYYWPSVLTLLSANDAYPTLCDAAKELADVKVPKNPPPLDAGLRMLLRKTSETVAAMGLLPTDIERPGGSGVLCTIAQGGTQKESGLGVYTGIYL